MAAHNRKSRTPTPSTMSGRRGSQASAMITDKPLPAVRHNVDDHDSTLVATITKRGSSPLHVREPASVSENETPSRATSSSSHKLAPSPSPATAAVTSFSDDMAGMLANIGQSQPAMELGLPSESLRLRDGKNGFPAALGRPLSDQETVSATSTSSTFLSASSSPQRPTSLPAASASDQASSMALKNSSAGQLSSFLDSPIFQSSAFLNHELYSLHSQQSQNRHRTEPFIDLHAPSPSLSSALAPSVDVPQIAPLFGKAIDDQGERRTGNRLRKGHHRFYRLLPSLVPLAAPKVLIDHHPLHPRLGLAKLKDRPRLRHDRSLICRIRSIGRLCLLRLVPYLVSAPYRLKER